VDPRFREDDDLFQFQLIVFVILFSRDGIELGPPPHSSLIFLQFAPWINPEPIEVLVFPRVLAQNPSIWQEDKILMIRGRLSDKDGEPKILCEEAKEVV